MQKIGQFFRIYLCFYQNVIILYLTYFNKNKKSVHSRTDFHQKFSYFFYSQLPKFPGIKFLLSLMQILESSEDHQIEAQALSISSRVLDLSLNRLY
jgi:hypothetical protein